MEELHIEVICPLCGRWAEMKASLSDQPNVKRGFVSAMCPFCHKASLHWDGMAWDLLDGEETQDQLQKEDLEIWPRNRGNGRSAG